MMRILRIALLLGLLACLFASCRKDHFDVNNVHGVNAEGEILLPIGSGSFTVTELMQQFNIDSMITCSEDGVLTYGFHFDDLGVVDGDSLLRFKDLEYNERFSFENPFPITLPQAFDTMFHFEHTIVFESDNIHVVEAEMETGHFDFDVKSNVGLLQRLVIHSSDITDEGGRDLELDFDLNSNDIQFDLDGLHYETDTANTLQLGYDVYVRLQSLPAQELFFEVDVKGSDLAIKEMSGFVDSYESRNVLDTTMNLFPGNASGSLQVQGARLKLYERNTFNLGARLDLDTAWIIVDDEAPYSIFGPQPVSVSVPPLSNFGQVFERSLNGKISANETGIYAVSNFIVNPSGMSNMVSVSDTSVIDVMIDAEIPFAFAMNDVRFVDTTDLNLNFEAPDQIEKLTLELTFTSTVPLDFNAQFFTYDFEAGRITDTLVAKDKLICASYDGKPVTTELTLEVTGEIVEYLNHSNGLISIYEIDTDAHNVCLKGDQQLGVFIKARVKYNGVVEF
ncbi:MAG: hypothetical protein IJK78_05910 [Bacteroidales bacterium]|nr:hypothetical protein [Bacteroidales bacterium]